MKRSIISLRDVTYRYPDAFDNVDAKQAASLRNINLDIEQGSFVLLCGESGCGKSTLTRLINGLIPHHHENGILEGSVIVDGKNTRQSSLYDISASVGSVFQNPRSQFFNVDTTSEIAFGLENHGFSADVILKRTREAIELCKVHHLLDQSIFHLSGGEKQKIACASTVALQGKIFVFDEPSANLDFSAIDDIRSVMKRLKEKGATIIVAEHRLHYLADLLDRVIYMNKGEIRGDWTAQEFSGITPAQLADLGLRPRDIDDVISWNTYSGIAQFAFPKTQSDTSRNAVWRIERMSFTYPKEKTPALDIKNLDIPTSKVSAIIGHNGAGKTTFLRCISGLEKHSGVSMCSPEGEVCKGKKTLKHSYMVFQDVNHQLFTEELIDEILLSMPEENTEKAHQLLRDMNLHEHIGAHPLGLSGGQKQRLAIASALASERPLLLFDEPTSGLDAPHMREVASQLRRLADSGKSVVLVSHDIELILLCADVVIVLDEGKIHGVWNLEDEGSKEKVQEFFMSMSLQKNKEKVNNE